MVVPCQTEYEESEGTRGGRNGGRKGREGGGVCEHERALPRRSLPKKTCLINLMGRTGRNHTVLGGWTEIRPIVGELIQYEEYQRHRTPPHWLQYCSVHLQPIQRERWGASAGAHPPSAGLGALCQTAAGPRGGHTPQPFPTTRATLLARGWLPRARAPPPSRAPPRPRPSPRRRRGRRDWGETQTAAPRPTPPLCSHTRCPPPSTPPPVVGAVAAVHSRSCPLPPLPHCRRRCRCVPPFHLPPPDALCPPARRRRRHRRCRAAAASPGTCVAVRGQGGGGGGGRVGR